MSLYCEDCMGACAVNLEACPDCGGKLAECEHPESECGICNYCGEEVDWVSRKFGYED
jgi:hypothetical protein